MSTFTNPNPSSDPLQIEIERWLAEFRLNILELASPPLGLGETPLESTPGLLTPQHVSTQLRAEKAQQSWQSLASLSPAQQIPVPVAAARQVPSHLAQEITFSKAKNVEPLKTVRPEELPRASTTPPPRSLIEIGARWLMAHVVDLSLVLLSISLALGVSFYFFVRIDSGAVPLGVQFRGWLPLKLMLELNLIEAFMFLYCLFAVYWCFFKLFVGKTIGSGVFLPKGETV